MSIDTDCFLSPEIDEWITHNRAQAAQWFDLAHALNRVHLTWLQALSIPDTEERKVMAALFLVRGGSNLQAAVTLAERGMTGEARTIIRSCFETAFYLGALVNDSEYVSRLKADEAARKRKLAQALLRRDNSESGLSDDERAKLSLYIEEVENGDQKAQEISIISAADAAGVREIYEIYYRDLSNDGAHPSLTSLLRNLGYNEAGYANAFRHGPDAPDIRRTIMAACVAAILIMQFAIEFLELPDADFRTLGEKYQELINIESRDS